jgi:hypothetical protein
MMDEKLQEVMEDAFLDELGQIKEAGILGTGVKALRGLIGGKRTLGSMWGQTRAAFRRGMQGATGSVRQRMGGGGQLAKMRAAETAGKEGGGGIIGGIREALKTPGGAAAATAAGGLGAGYIGMRALRGGSDRRY